MSDVATGTGLLALSAAILASTVISRYGPVDQAAHAASFAAPGHAGALTEEEAIAMNRAVALAAPPGKSSGTSTTPQSASSGTSAPVWFGISSVTASNEEVVFLARAMADGSIQVGRCAYRSSSDFRRMNQDPLAGVGFQFSGWSRVAP